MHHYETCAAWPLLFLCAMRDQKHFGGRLMTEDLRPVLMEQEHVEEQRGSSSPSRREVQAGVEMRLV